MAAQPVNPSTAQLLGQYGNILLPLWLFYNLVRAALVGPVPNDFRYFDKELEVSKMGLVVQLVSMYCFSTTPLLSTLRVNFMYVSPNIVYFGHSSRLFALILC